SRFGSRARRREQLMPGRAVESTNSIHSWTADGIIAGIVLAPEGGGPYTQPARAPRLLLVEDDYFTAVENRSVLEATGHEVVGLAASFEEAIRVAEAERPDLAIMDIRLASAKDGVEAATEIMRRFGIPCLFVSAYTDEATRRRAAPAQPLGWLTKPFTGEQLVRSVRDALNRLPPPKS
ncbi:MAG TPA: response regulator, partial [Afifellaceae bacterium]|nr:response regulator [Afifellaceae bacterium]